MDFTYLNSISDGDKEFINQFITTFKSNTEKLVNAMKESFSKKDFESLGRQAHQLKPSLEMLKLETYDDCLFIQDNPKKATSEKIDKIARSCEEALATLKSEYGV